MGIMKVLFLLNTGFDTPGPSNHLLESIIHYLLEDGCRVHIIEKNSGGIDANIPQSISNHKNLSFDAVTFNVPKKNRLIKRYLLDVKYAVTSSKYYKQHRDADVIFVQSANTSIFPVMLSKYLLKKPIVYNVQDIWPLNALQISLLKRKSLAYKILDKIQERVYNNASHLVTISKDMKETLVKKGISSNKISVVHNWSYHDECFNIAVKDNYFIDKYNIDLDRFNVIYAGNIGKMQNIEIIIEAAKILKDEDNIHFYFVGDGVEKNNYQEKVKDYNLSNVTFLPMQPAAKAHYIYAMADVNVIPLHKGVIKTALPSKTAVCLATGRPIIACLDLNSNFAQSISKLDNCYVVDPKSSKDLANQIFKNYTREKEYNSSSQCEFFKKEFSKKTNAKKYIKVFKDVVEQNK